MFSIRISKSFSGAHQLREYQGKCEQLHGHNWKVEVVLGSDKLNSTGMVMDFKDAKGILKEALKEFDHKHLNDVTPFDKINPTAENMAKTIFDRMSERVKEFNVRVGSVTVWETEKNCAVYEEH